MLSSIMQITTELCLASSCPVLPYVISDGLKINYSMKIATSELLGGCCLKTISNKYNDELLKQFC